MTAVVEPGRLRITHGAGETTSNRELEYTGELLGPAGARKLIRSSLNEIGDKVIYRTFRAELGIVVEHHLELMAVENGVYRVEETADGAPAGTSQWLDAQGKIVRSVVPSPFGEMETILSDAATAKMAMAAPQDV